MYIAICVTVRLQPSNSDISKDFQAPNQTKYLLFGRSAITSVVDCPLHSCLCYFIV